MVRHMSAPNIIVFPQTRRIVAYIVQASEPLALLRDEGFPEIRTETVHSKDWPIRDNRRSAWPGHPSGMSRTARSRVPRCLNAERSEPLRLFTQREQN